jgi:ATP-binding cassette subfamily F protein uup
VQPGIRVGYVPQEPIFRPRIDVFEAVVSGMGETRSCSLNITKCRIGWRRDGDHEALMARMETLQHELEARGAWAYEAQADQVIDRFGLDPDAKLSAPCPAARKNVWRWPRRWPWRPKCCCSMSRPITSISPPSNGWRTMLIETVTLFFITHDRSFLDRVCTRIVELDRGKLASFPGNFSRISAAQGAVAARGGAGQCPCRQAAQGRRGLDSQRRRGTAYAGRLPRSAARSSCAPNARRGASGMGKVNLQLDAGDKSGKLVAELEHVSKCYGERQIVRDFSARIQRGDKIGVIGPNGAGKTTLLRMILGELQPDGHRPSGHQDGCRLLRPVPHPAQPGFDADPMSSRRARTSSKSAARAST